MAGTGDRTRGERVGPSPNYTAGPSGPGQVWPGSSEGGRRGGRGRLRRANSFTVKSSSPGTWNPNSCGFALYPTFPVRVNFYPSFWAGALRGEAPGAQDEARRNTELAGAFLGLDFSLAALPALS